MEYTKFIILCHPRSGSSYLNSLLNNHPHISSFGEAAITKTANKKLNGISFTTYLHKYIYTEKHNSIKAVGIKFFYEHDSIAPDFLEYLSKEKSIRIINLVRKDILKSYTSWLIATKTSTWLQFDSKNKIKVDNKRIYVSPELFINYRESLKEEFKFYKEYFKSHKILSLSYEDLTKDVDAELNKTLLFLGVKPVKLKSFFQKQNPEAMEELIENYSEVIKLNEYLDA